MDYSPLPKFFDITHLQVGTGVRLLEEDDVGADVRKGVLRVVYNYDTIRYDFVFTIITIRPRYSHDTIRYELIPTENSWRARILSCRNCKRPLR